MTPRAYSWQDTGLQIEGGNLPTEVGAPDGLDYFEGDGAGLPVREV
jgi:hypothetical protein